MLNKIYVIKYISFNEIEIIKDIKKFEIYNATLEQESGGFEAFVAINCSQQDEARPKETKESPSKICQGRYSR